MYHKENMHIVHGSMEATGGLDRTTNKTTKITVTKLRVVSVNHLIGL